VFGLLGPNGAGKTTVIRVVTTLLKPTAGTMEVFGLDTTRSTMRVRRLIGYVPQQLSIDGQLTGYENVWLFARLYDVPRRQRRGQAEAALAQVGLEQVAGRLASTYSGGMVRRLELAQALVSRPRLLVLDEPTIGLDPLARAGVWERVLELRAEEAMTVLLTTHYMEEAEQLCDRAADRGAPAGRRPPPRAGGGARAGSHPGGRLPRLRLRRIRPGPGRPARCPQHPPHGRPARLSSRRPSAPSGSCGAARPR
jgi:ABC-type Na+ transport system ATPase subunit NatA